MDVICLLVTQWSAFSVIAELLLYHFNREEILHSTVVKFITSRDFCAHLTWKN